MCSTSCPVASSTPKASFEQASTHSISKTAIDSETFETRGLKLEPYPAQATRALRFQNLLADVKRATKREVGHGTTSVRKFKLITLGSSFIYHPGNDVRFCQNPG